MEGVRGENKPANIVQCSHFRRDLVIATFTHSVLHYTCTNNKRLRPRLQTSSSKSAGQYIYQQSVAGKIRRTREF